MTQDLYYYDAGYTDDNYFVYTADAESLEAGTFSMTAACGVIKAASVDLTSSFSQTVTISHIEGADLFALSNTLLAAEVAAIRDNNVQVTSAFTQTTAGARIRYVGSDQFIDATISADNLRVRFNEAAVDAAFSLTADLTRKPGTTVEATGTWSSDFIVDARGTRKQNIIDCDVSAAFTQTTDGNRIRGLESSLLESTVFEVALIGVIKQGAADLTSVFSQTIDNSRIRNFESAENALFTPGLTVTVFKNSFAVLDSVATVQATAEVNKPFASAMSSASSLSTVITKIVETSSNLTLTSTLAVPYTSFKNKRPYTVWRKQISNNALSTPPDPATYLSSDFKYGTGSLYVPDGGANKIVISPDNGFYINDNEDFIINAWVKIPTLRITGDLANKPFIKSNNLEIGYLTNSVGITSSYFRFGPSATANRLTNTNYTDSNVWTLFRASRSGSTISFRVGNTTSTTTYSGSIDATSLGFTLGATRISGLAVPIYFDDLFFAVGTNVIENYKGTSGASEIFDGALTTTQFLYHFNGDYVDEMAGIQNAAAALTSSSTLSASAGKSVVADAAISSSATVTATLNKIYQGAATIESNGFVAAAVGRIRPFVDIEVATFTASIDASVIRSGASSQSVNATVDATATRNIGPILADLSALTSQTTIGNIVAANSASLTVDGFLMSAIGRIRPEVADLTSAFSLAVDYFVGKVANASLSTTTTVSAAATKNIGPILADLTSQSTMAAQVNALPGGSVSLNANTSVAASGDRIRFSSAALTSTSTVYADGDIIRLLSSNLSANTLVAATGYRIKQFSSNFTTIATEINVVNKIGNTLINCDVVSTLTATARVLAASSVAMDATTALTTSTTVNKPFASALTNETQLVAQAEAGIIGECDAQVTSSLTITPIATVNGLANLAANFTQVADTGAVRNAISLEMSSGTLTATANIIKSTSSNSTANTSLTVLAGKVQNAQADLRCEGFILSDGTVINLEASAIWYVPREITLWNVPLETKDYVIEFEQRTYKIKG